MVLRVTADPEPLRFLAVVVCLCIPLAAPWCACILIPSSLPPAHAVHVLSLAAPSMDTPSLPPSSTASPSCRPPPEALSQLLAHGLQKGDIVALRQLGSAGLARLLAMIQAEGQSGVSALVESLERISEDNMVRFIDLSIALTSTLSRSCPATSSRRSLHTHAVAYLAPPCLRRDDFESIGLDVPEANVCLR